MAEHMTSAHEGFRLVDAHRWLGPAMFGALVSAAVTVLRRGVIEPGMPRMSSEWLLSHDKYGGRRWTN